MVTLTITDGDKTIESNGEIVIAFVINPDIQDDDGEKPDCAALMMGKGNTYNAMMMAISGLGSVMMEAVENEMARLLIAKIMVEKFMKVITGADDGLEVETGTEK